MKDLFKYNSTDDLSAPEWEALRAKVIGGAAFDRLKKYTPEVIEAAEMSLIDKDYLKPNGLTTHKGRMVFGWDTSKTATGKIPDAVAGCLRPSGNGK